MPIALQGMWQRRSASPIDALSVFVEERNGVLLDSLYGTTFETGQRCVAWEPRVTSGLSVFTALSGTTARPTLVNDRMVFDGVANVMKGANGLFAAAPGFSLAIAGQGSSTPISYIINAGSTTNYLGLYTATGAVGALVVGGAGPLVQQYQSYRGALGEGVYVARAKLSDGITGIKPQWLNGTPLFGQLIGGSVSVSSVVFPSTTVAIGARNGDSTLFSACSIRLAAMFANELTTEETAELSELLVAASGIRGYELSGAPYGDSEPAVAAVGYDVVSQYATLMMNTDAEDVHLLTQPLGTLGAYQVAYRVNGGAKTVIDVPTVAYPRIALGSGGTMKALEFEVGHQSAPTGPPNAGVYLKQIWTPAGRTLDFVAPTPTTRRLVAVGDSIYTGQAATTYQLGGAGALIRASYPGRVTNVSAGWYSLKDLSTLRYGSVTALANALIALADGATTNELLLQISTNDFGLTKWSTVAEYQAAYTQLLTLVGPHFDQIWVQTAGPRTDIVSNGIPGQTLAQFRTATTAAVSASGLSNVTIIDGTAIYGLGAGDGLHPPNAEQTVYANNLRSAMGF